MIFNFLYFSLLFPNLRKKIIKNIQKKKKKSKQKPKKIQVGDDLMGRSEFERVF